MLVSNREKKELPTNFNPRKTKAQQAFSHELKPEESQSTQLELFLLLYCHNKCLLFIFIAFRLFPSLLRADFCLKRSILSNIISRAGHELLPSSQSRWETKQKKAAQVSYFFTIRCYRIRSYFIRCLRLGCYWIQVYRFGCYRTWILHI